MLSTSRPIPVIYSSNKIIFLALSYSDVSWRRTFIFSHRAQAHSRLIRGVLIADSMRLSLLPSPPFSERRYCDARCHAVTARRCHVVCVCVCARARLSVRSGPVSEATLKRLKLRTSNLTCMFPGTVGQDPLQCFGKGARAYFIVQLINKCAVVKSNCAVVKRDLCSCKRPVHKTKLLPPAARFQG